MWQHWLNFLMGLWVIVSAFSGMSASAMATNLMISGVIVAALALWGALQQQSHMRHHDSSYKTT